MLQKITDYVQRTIARLIFFVRELLPERGIAQALGSQAQDAEDALFAAYQTTRDLDNATGATLDALGALLGAPLRGTRNDADYRARIKAQIPINTYKGTEAELYNVAKLLVPAWAAAPAQVRYEDETVMTYTVKSDPVGAIVTTDQARELAREIAKAGPTGTRLIVYSQPQSVSTSFGFLGVGVGFGAGFFIGAYDK